MTKQFFRSQAQAIGFRTPSDLAKAIGVSPFDVVELWEGRKWQLVEADLDPVYGALAAYVDRQIGTLMSVRVELQRKLDADRRKRAAERTRTLNR